MSVQQQIDDINRRLNDVKSPNELREDTVLPTGGTVVVVDPTTDEFVKLPTDALGGGGNISYSPNELYIDLAELIAEQDIQFVNSVYYVIDATDDPNVVARGTTDAYYRYAGAANDGDANTATIDDYLLLPPSLNAQSPPIAKTYTTQALMLADQSIQKTGFIYRVGNDTFEKLATSAGVISDYKQVNVGGELEKITEGGKTGYRIRGVNPDNYGNIGQNAVDLSFSNNISSDYGATGDFSHAEGDTTTASGQASHAEGISTIASGDYSHAEGDTTTASGQASHAEGISTIASGDYSHAEGDSTTASGEGSHAEGFLTTSSGDYSHAEGDSTIASGQGSHAEGYFNTARSQGEHSGGNFGTDYTPLNNNTDRLVNYGNGLGFQTRSDAWTLFKNGAHKFFSAPLTSILNTVKTGFVMLDETYALNIHNGIEWLKIAFLKAKKEITAASYTLTQADTKKHLIFTQACTVTVPTGLTIDSVFEGECSNGKVTFVNASGVTINVFSDFKKNTAGSFAVFGLRVTASNVATLYGTLEIA